MHIELLMAKEWGIAALLSRRHPIGRIRITNTTPTLKENLRVVIHYAPAFLYEESYPLPPLSEGEVYEWIPKTPAFAPAFLSMLSHPTEGTIAVGILDKDCVEAAKECSLILYPPFTLPSHHAEPLWNGVHVDPLYSRFPHMEQRANAYLKRTHRDSTLSAYANVTPDVVRGQVEALYHALHEENIVPSGEAPYLSAPCGYDALLKHRRGNARDLAFFFAGLLEHAGLYPVLIATAYHMDVAVWLTPTVLPEAVTDDPTLFLELAQNQKDRICFVDPLAAAGGSTFAASESGVLSRLNDTAAFLYAVDIQKARMQGVSPLSCLTREGETLTVSLPDFLVHNASPVDTSSHSVPPTREAQWERKLLDLSLRNALLSFSVDKRGVVLAPPSIQGLLHATQGGDCLLLEAPGQSRSIAEYTPGIPVSPAWEEELSQGRIHTWLAKETLHTRLTSLYRTSRTSLEESGANPLYMTIGLLKWYESPSSQTPRYAPLILFPCELIRKNMPRGYAIRPGEEEPTVNITLLEFLKAEYDLEIPLTESLPRGDLSLGIQLVINTVKKYIREFTKWEVLEITTLGIFSFNRFILWSDLRNRIDIIRQNKLVASLITGRADTLSTVTLSPPDEKNALPPMALPYDSSQLSAILRSCDGDSFVLHGPPGTGKSQTIANMIATNLYLGKSVLFVAEKGTALSVVEKRLEALGLGPFLMSLHSEKTKKQEILEHLNRTISLPKSGKGAEWMQKKSHLETEKDKLRDVMDAIHTPHMGGMSLYDAVVQYETFRDKKSIPCYDSNTISALTRSSYLQVCDTLTEYTLAALGCGGVGWHPLAMYHKRTATAEDKTVLHDTISRYIATSDLFCRTRDAVGTLFGLEDCVAYDTTSKLVDLVSYLTSLSAIPYGILTAPTLMSSASLVEKLSSVWQAYTTQKETILASFTPDILKEDAALLIRDAKAAMLSPLLLRPARKKRERIRLAIFANTPEAITWEDVSPTWESLHAYQETKKRLLSLLEACIPLFGSFIDGENTNVPYLVNLYEQAVTIKKLALTCVDTEAQLPPLLTRLDTLVGTGGLVEQKTLFSTLITSYKRLTEEATALANAMGNTEEDIRLYPDWPRTTVLSLERFRDHLSGLRDYVIYLEHRDRVWGLGLQNLTVALETNEIREQDVIPCYLKSVAEGIIDILSNRGPHLRYFNGKMLTQKISAIQEASQKYRSMCREEILRALCDRLPTHGDDPVMATEITTLGRAIRTGCRGMSLRRLLDSIPTLLRRTSPCFLMSPLSCAKYLGTNTPPFDVVIFDEASQIPTCEAVSAIARAKSVVIVGDPNQLPPTGFFSSSYDEEVLGQAMPDNLLDDCLALGMPESHLMWHYRSRHESLIAYSNHAYYEGKLHTFPSPTAPNSHVTMVYVEGTYDRGNTKQNRYEAEAVVSEVIRRLRADVPQTIGIVTFSSPQQNLIEDLLEERVMQDPALASLHDALEAPIFVKNLETVQGDERDCILFSIGYGPDATGRVSLNLGPLNREGGWRRLNVAITRSKEEMLVFTSLHPEDIDLSRTASRGIRELRGFLEYAKTGKLSIRGDWKPVPSEPHIADIVADALRRRGWQVDTQIGHSLSRVDIGVRHPKRQEEYLMGILTDHHMEGSITDRFETREKVLSGLGWHLLRVWSCDYHEDPKACLDTLEKALKDAAMRPLETKQV